MNIKLSCSECGCPLESHVCPDVSHHITSAGVEAMAIEIIDWQRRFNDVIDELNNAGSKRIKVIIKSVDDTVASFISIENRRD